MKIRYQTEMTKNVLIPMSDGVTLAADLYRPVTDQPVPGLISFTPYHKDGDYTARYGEAVKGLTQAGYAHLIVDVRGTGNSGGGTVQPWREREQRDYYEVVEWLAAQDWCAGKVGVWGKSYGGIATLLTAATNPPHLAAVAPFMGVAASWRDLMYVGGRLSSFTFIAQFGSRMASWNFMPPGYRDPEGRWLSVWREHLESNEPWVVSALDTEMAGEADFETIPTMLERIQTPVYVWAGWRDVLNKEMADAYRIIRSPKKLIAGPWFHVLPDVGHAGRIDLLEELGRWFDYWLKEEDTGIMDEPPVAVWVQGTNRWYFEDDFPPPQVEKRELCLEKDGALLEVEAGSLGEGVDSFVYDATSGVCGDVRQPAALELDHRADEWKGLTYTTAPLEEDVEICGAPEVTVHFESTAPETLIVAKLCDVYPDGRSHLVTSGWFDVDQPKGGPEEYGELLEGGKAVLLRMLPTAYVFQRGHSLRLVVSGAHFPFVAPGVGAGEISVRRGKGAKSSVIIPVRPERGEAPKPGFLIAQEIPHPPTSASSWSIALNPDARTTTVHMGFSSSLGIDGGEEPATVGYDHQCWAIAPQTQPAHASTRAKTRGCWESENEKIEVSTVTVFRGLALDLSVEITLNGASYWQGRWSRSLEKTEDGD
jgi:predicted acyl esterase